MVLETITALSSFRMTQFLEYSLLMYSQGGVIFSICAGLMASRVLELEFHPSDEQHGTTQYSKTKCIWTLLVIKKVLVESAQSKNHFLNRRTRLVLAQLLLTLRAHDIQDGLSRQIPAGYTLYMARVTIDHVHTFHYEYHSKFQRHRIDA